MIELRPAKYLLGRLAPMDNNDKIPQFNLGAGTYNSTVYLRGDGVWANPLAGAGFVPLTRELTINGVTYDLSVNRTWTIDTTSATWGNITGTLSNQTDLQNALNAKEPTIAPGLTSQYWRGDKTWQTLNKAAVGLGNVDNTSDANKPISTATQTALNSKENTANKGIPGGYASLAGDGKVPSDQLPSYVDDVIEVANYAALPTVGQTGVIYITLDNNNVYRWAGSVYVQISQPNAVWGSITGTLSSQTDLQNALNAKQDDITLTTIGNSGAATFIGNTLNIPQYDGGLIGYVPYTGATTNVNLGEYGLSAGWVQIDTSPTTYTPGVGKLGWNNSDGTLEFQLLGGNVTLQIGQEQVARVVNKTDPSIDLLESNYQVVKVGGAQGNRLKVALAQANNDANSAETLGIVTEDIPKNQEGFITTSGIVRNINTTGSLQGETWLDGDMLFLSGTVAGQMTKVKPSAPIHTVILGYVIRAHATQGQIYVKVDNGYELGELHDVNTTISKTTPVDTDSVLLQDTADSNIWKKLSWLNTKATLKTYFDTLYQAAGSYVPSSRTLTVNGTTYDLSANRSWTIDKASVGLGNVDNTSDLNKPISTATQTALNAKQDDITLTTTGTSGAATLVGATLNIPQYQSVITNPITGTGTLNYVAKFTPGSSSIGDSLIYDNGTNVGIGNTLPNEKLELSVGNGVAGGLRINYASTATSEGMDITYLNTGATVTSFDSRYNSNNAVMQFRMKTAATAVTAMTILGNGYVGIGATNPGAKLDIDGGDLYVRTGGRVVTNTIAPYTGDLTINLGGSGNNLIVSGGNVGIGTTNPNVGKLELNYNSVNNRAIRLQDQNGIFDIITSGAGQNHSFGLYDDTNGDYRLFVKSNGYVGIGNTNPTEKLDVAGVIRAESVIRIEGAHTTTRYENILPAAANGAGTGIAQMSWWVSEPNISWTSAGFGYNVTNNGAGSYGFGRINNSFGQAYMRFIESGNLHFYNADTGGTRVETMLLRSDGNIGIGTTTPDNGKLTILKNSSYATENSYGISIQSNTSNAYTELLIGADDTVDCGIIQTAGKNTSFTTKKLSLQPNGGNVGIGTTNPGSRLTVQTSTSSSSDSLRITDGTGVINIGHWDTVTNRFEFSGKPTYFVQYGSGNYMSFGTNGSEKMRITSAGYVGIGTDIPSEKLTVQGNIYASQGGLIAYRTDGGTGLSINGGDLGSGSYIARFKNYSNDDKVVIKGNGNVGLGTSTPSYKLEVVGSVNFDSSKQYTVNNSNGNSYEVYFNAGSGANAWRHIYGGSGTGFGVGVGGYGIYYEGNGDYNQINKPNGNVLFNYYVGIGTSNPTKKLHITNSVNYGSVNDQIFLEGTIIGGTPSNPAYYGGITFNAGGYEWGAIRAIQANPAASWQNRLAFFTMNGAGGTTAVERMSIDNNGFVGIGTSDQGSYPFAAKLSVAGNISVTGTKIGWGVTDAFTLNGIDTAHYGLSSNFNLVQLSGYGGVVFATLGAERMRITTNGNVGINITNPQKPLEVYSNANNFVSVGVNNLGVGQWSGIQFGYREANSAYRKSAIVFERTDLTANDAQGKIHILNGPQNSPGSATLSDAKLTIAENGNVGIGTTNPGAKLDVFDPSSSSTSPTIALKQGTSGSYANIAGAGDMFHGIIMRGIPANSNDYSVTAGDYMSFYEYGGEFIFYKKQPGVLTPQMIIKSSGYVGIGTTNPLDKLDVFGNQFLGDGSNTTQLYFRGVSGVSYAWSLKNLNTGFQIKSTSPGAGDGFNIDFNNNVGIGTTSPQSKLSVDGDIRLQSSTASPKSLIFSSPASNWGPQDSSLKFIPSDGVNAATSFTVNLWDGIGSTSERMRITAGGNVGIGATVPYSKLDVTDWTTYISVSSAANSESTYDGQPLAGINFRKHYAIGIGASIKQLQAGGINNYSQAHLAFYTNDASVGWNDPVERMRITSGGNVGIGQTNPTKLLSLKRASICGIELNDSLAVTDIKSVGGRFIIDTPSQAYIDIASSHQLYVDLKSVGVHTAAPDQSAALDVSSTTQGFLPPRMTSSEMNLIPAPAAGLMVWNTDINLFCGFDGSNWRKIVFA